MWCPSCGLVQVSERAKFCSACGGRVVDERAKCPMCGKEVVLWDKFCPECGRPIQAEMRAIAQERVEREEVWDR